jgi:hypothetical protein
VKTLPTLKQEVTNAHNFEQCFEFPNRN